MSERTNVYKTIASVLIEEIQQNKWKVGDLLPAEKDLMARFSVSRNSAREALRTLKDQGYISRNQGSRSVVVSTKSGGAYVNVVTTHDDVTLFIRETESTLLSIEHVLVDSSVAATIGCLPGEKRLRILFLRLREDTRVPPCYTEVYVWPEFEDVASVLKGSITVYDKIESHFSVSLSHVIQEIEVRRADANVASRLNMQVEDPVLVVVSSYFVPSGSLAEVSISHFPSQLYKVRINLNRAGGGTAKSSNTSQRQTAILRLP